jgi:hypothetical protein
MAFNGEDIIAVVYEAQATNVMKLVGGRRCGMKFRKRIIDGE